MLLYNYSRRPSRDVRVGKIGIGGKNPIRIQSMANTDTNDIHASAMQAIEIAAEGGELVRFTTQGVKEATALREIIAEIRKKGVDVPISADVHFNPKAAFKAAETADKVRINPGNFVDAARTFRKLEFTEQEYAAEIEKIRTALLPFLELCRKGGKAIRLGVNHGSLSDRIMSRYGDTPEGMVESVMEYLRIAREVDFHEIVISIKASNTSVMVRTVQLLVEQMQAEEMDYPLHLGVTEAGDAEDGRIKSAVGIGALLAEGLGDTIRVSLSESPVCEIPVAVALRDYISERINHPSIVEPSERKAVSRAYSAPLGLQNFPVAFHADNIRSYEWQEVEASSLPEAPTNETPIIINSSHLNRPGEVASYIDRLQSLGAKNPIIISLRYETPDLELLRIQAGADFGALLLNGYGSGIRIENPNFNSKTLSDLELAILQAARLRMSKTEYIACPSCGRTLFDLPATLKEVKEATSHLTGLKIGVMGCIVNGPGEMADADYGYVGAGPGRVSLYKGKELVKRNIPASEALPELLTLIASNK